MNANTTDGVSRRLMIWGVALLLVAGVFSTHDHLTVTINGQKQIISRANNPAAYWGSVAGVLVVGSSLLGYGVYRSQRKKYKV